MLSEGAYISVHLFQILKRLTNVPEIWYRRFAVRAHFKAVLHNFQQSLIIISERVNL
jgi:hypothetical protein